MSKRKTFLLGMVIYVNVFLARLCVVIWALRRFQNSDMAFSFEREGVVLGP